MGNGPLWTQDSWVDTRSIYSLFYRFHCVRWTKGGSRMLRTTASEATLGSTMQSSLIPCDYHFGQANFVIAVLFSSYNRRRPELRLAPGDGYKKVRQFWQKDGVKITSNDTLFIFCHKLCETWNWNWCLTLCCHRCIMYSESLTEDVTSVIVIVMPHGILNLN